MSYPIIFEDEAMEIVREAEKKGKEIILKEKAFNGQINCYEKRMSNYDGIYISEWHNISSKGKTGYSNREMAKAIYDFCNRYQTKPILR